MTSPLPDALVTALKSKTAWRFDTELGATFSPRFFCCTDPNELGIVDGKEPVAIIEASSDMVTTGTGVSFDGTNSYDPDGSIVGYSWSFPGGSPSSGTVATVSGVTFASAGQKKVRLTVTDGTGKRSVPAIRVITVKAADDLFETDTVTGAGGVYVTTLDGVYYSTDSGQSWSDVSGDLSGDGLIIRAFSQDPASYQQPQASHILWAGTDDGLYVTINGGTNWTQSNSGSDFVDLQWFGDILYAAANTGGTPVIYYANVSAARAGGSVTWSEV